MSTLTIAQMAAITGSDKTAIDAELETAFSEAVGEKDYQRLLDQQWLPFQGTAHMNLQFQDAVAAEVRAAREFLEAL